MPPGAGDILDVTVEGVVNDRDDALRVGRLALALALALAFALARGLTAAVAIAPAPLRLAAPRRGSAVRAPTLLQRARLAPTVLVHLSREDRAAGEREEQANARQAVGEGQKAVEHVATPLATDQGRAAGRGGPRQAPRGGPAQLKVLLRSFR